MKSSRLNKILLEKDIELISNYSDYENRCLSKIANTYENCCKFYKSSNTSLLLNKKIDVDNMKKKIKEKRDKYVSALHKAIVQYSTIEENIKNKINKEAKNYE